MLLVLVTVAVFVPVVLAQNVNIAESPKKAGDPIRYTLVLDGPVKGTVVAIVFSFQIKSDVKTDQKGLITVFAIDNFKQLAENKFEVEGVIPQVATGKYQLGSVQLRIKEGGIRTFVFPDDLKQEIALSIENSEKGIFPNVKSIESTH
jgi:hypothetical protein